MDSALALLALDLFFEILDYHKSFFYNFGLSLSLTKVGFGYVRNNDRAG